MFEALTEDEHSVDETAETAGLRQSCVSKLLSCLRDCVPVIIGKRTQLVEFGTREEDAKDEVG